MSGGEDKGPAYEFVGPSKSADNDRRMADYSCSLVQSSKRSQVCLFGAQRCIRPFQYPQPRVTGADGASTVQWRDDHDSLVRDHPEPPDRLGSQIMSTNQTISSLSLFWHNALHSRFGIPRVRRPFPISVFAVLGVNLKPRMDIPGLPSSRLNFR